eukprot:scaffold66229_cov78-Phaeocystis_antarctica.AAC.1
MSRSGRPGRACMAAHVFARRDRGSVTGHDGLASVTGHGARASHDLRALPTTESGYFEASVVMWHNQRVINTPNHRYNYASDPGAIAVCPTCNLCLRWTLFAAIWVIWTLSTVRSPRTHPVARRSRGARRA